MLAGTGRYDHPDEWDELDQAETALATVADCLEGLGYHSAKTASYLLNPSKDELGSFFRSTPADAEVVLAYYTGHGHVDGLHYLVARNSSVGAPDFITGSAIPTRELPSLLAVRDRDSGRPNSPQPYLLIIVDTCFSGAGAIQITRDQLAEVVDPDRTWVLASARPAEYARQGAFPAALRLALADSTAGRTQPYVDPNVVAESINDRLPDYQEVRAHGPASGVARVPPFFPNPDHQPVPAGLTLTDQAHWVSRLRGTAGPDAGYYITGGEGRTAAVRDIVGWISEPDRGAVGVVTGRPGSGKSALLALPALVTDVAQWQRLLAAAGDRPIVQAANLLRPGTRVIAVHGRGLNADQLAGAIAAGLGRAAHTTRDLLDALERQPARDHPVVLLDALDETEQPGAVAGQLVTELARHGLRLLIGTREHLIKTIADPSLLIDLDKQPYADTWALTDYVTQLLVAGHEQEVTTPYQPLQHRDDGILATIAAAVSTKAAGSFLIGQLIALALRGRDQIADAEHLDDIPASVGEAFDADLARLGDRSAHARVLLTALAWAKGPGLPWENIWVPVVNAIRPALAARTSQPLRDEDIRWLRGEAGAYIIEDTGPGGRSVFRPFHDLLTAHLQASGEEPGRDTVSPGHREWVNGLIADALLASVPADETGARLWAQAHPYLRSYLAQHAADAGADRLTALLTGDPGYLATADSATLVPLLMRTQLPELAEASSVYRRAAPLLSADVRWNAAYLQEAALTLGASGLSEAFAADQLAPAFDTVISPHGADTSILALTGHTGSVCALAAVPLPDGRTLLASGSDRGTVLLWDPVTGQSAGPPLKNYVPVLALAAVPLPSGRTLLASSNSATVQLWDPETGQPAGPPLQGHQRPVEALAVVPLPGGRTVLASAAEDGKVLLWDPATSQPAGPQLEGYAGRVWALAAVPLPGGQTLLASAGHGGTVRLWDPATSQPAGPPLRGHRNSVQALAAVPLPGGRTVLASGDDWGTVRLWDPATGQPAGPPLEEYFGPVRALAAVPLPDGRSVLAIGGPGGAVRLWDPATSQPVGPPLRGHTRPVQALAVVPLPGGRTVLASAAEDGMVRLWDPGTSHPAEPSQEGHTGPVFALAAVSLPGARTVLASAGKDGKVLLWDPATRQPTGPPLHGHAGPVRALAALPLPDGRTVLASAGKDGKVLLWDPATHQPAGPPQEGHTGRVWALAAVPLPGGRTVLASAGQDSRVLLWDPATSQPAGPPLKGHTGQVVALAAVPLPGGRTVLASAAEEAGVLLWDPATSQPAGPPLKGYTGRVAALAAVPLPGGRTVLASAGQDSRVLLWDPATSEPAGPPLQGHTEPVRALAAVPLPGGRTLLASGSFDGTVRLWDPVNGRLVARISRRAPLITLLGWDGSLLAIGSDDGLTVISVARLPSVLGDD
jgi:WD40 repeat protein